MRYGTSCTAVKNMEPSHICVIISITIFRDDPDLFSVLSLIRELMFNVSGVGMSGSGAVGLGRVGLTAGGICASQGTFF